MIKPVEGKGVLGRVGRLGLATLVIAILGALTAGSYCWYRTAESQARQTVTGPFNLHIASAHLELGSVWESNAFHWVLPIANQGEQDVEIEDLITSCNCMNVEPRAGRVSAHQTLPVRLTIDLTQGRRPNPGVTDGEPFELTIRPKFRARGASAEAVHWVLRGTVRPLLRLQPTVIDLGDVSELSGTTTTRFVQVNCASPLKSLKLGTNPGELSSEVKSVSGSADRYELIVSVPSKPRLGRIEQDLLLKAELDAGGGVTKAVRVTGRVVADCQSTPRRSGTGGALDG